MYMKGNNMFDLIVIGTGTAASTAAQKCRSEGWSVAIVDSDSLWRYLCIVRRMRSQKGSCRSSQNY